MAGIRLPGRAHIQVPTVPPEFDLEDWKASLERMRAKNFARIYLTHFGPVDEVQAHLSTAAVLLARYAEAVRQAMVRGAARGEIIRQIVEWEGGSQTEGGPCTQGEVTQSGFGSISTYVDGIMRYWSKRLDLLPAR
jgi:glyoxylase-like metal-dependent hydrolase (beta-lactamase superfamily II)